MPSMGSSAKKAVVPMLAALCGLNTSPGRRLEDQLPVSASKTLAKVRYCFSELPDAKMARWPVVVAGEMGVRDARRKALGPRPGATARTTAVGRAPAPVARDWAHPAP